MVAQAFRRTIRRGLKELGKLKAQGLTGKELFMLQDTYGFPLELSVEEAYREDIQLSENWRAEFDAALAAATSAANTAAKAATDAAAGITDTLNEQNTKIGAIGKKLDDHISDVAGNKGGNTYNVTSQVPLASGYYTLTTAVATV